MCALAPDPIELERIVSLLDIGHLLDRDAPAGRDMRDRQFPGFRFAQSALQGYRAKSTERRPQLLCGRL
jgi:hypothetical protein